MSGITYALVEEKYEGENNDNRISYGIVACSNIETDGTSTIVASVRDITNDKKRICALIKRCNNLNLSVIHLNDVVEDFLAS
jgi:hypothetical protein